jgi:hypothetical protein
MFGTTGKRHSFAGGFIFIGTNEYGFETDEYNFMFVVSV